MWKYTHKKIQKLYDTNPKKGIDDVPSKLQMVTVYKTMEHIKFLLLSPDGLFGLNRSIIKDYWADIERFVYL